MKTTRWLAVLALVLGLVSPAAATTRSRARAARRRPRRRRRSRSSTRAPLGDIQEKGEIVIGVKYDVPPFGFNNPSSGKVEGFDVDLGQAVADKLGVKPKFIEAISDNRIPFLQDGTADLILSTMTINEERVGQIEFSDPYYIAKGRILVKKDNSEIAASTRSPARTSAPRSARPTRRRSRSRRPTPSSSSWTPTRSASSRCRTAASTRSRPTT